MVYSMYNKGKSKMPLCDSCNLDQRVNPSYWELFSFHFHFSEPFRDNAILQHAYKLYYANNTRTRVYLYIILFYLTDAIDNTGQ